MLTLLKANGSFVEVPSDVDIEVVNGEVRCLNADGTVLRAFSPGEIVSYGADPAFALLQSRFDQSRITVQIGENLPLLWTELLQVLGVASDTRRLELECTPQFYEELHNLLEAMVREGYARQIA